MMTTTIKNTTKAKKLDNTKIVFLMPNLASKGGAERVITSFANWLIENNTKYEPIIITLDHRPSAYKINNKVKFIQPNLKNEKRRLFTIFERINFCRKTIREEKPKYIVTFYSKMTLYVKIASANKDSIIIGSERANPKIGSHMKQTLSKIAFRMCDKFIFQTKGAQKYFKNSETKSIVIPNPINEKSKQIPDEQKENRIIAVGRLEKQKGFDILIQAFAQVHQKNPSYQLVIFGEGNERKNLQDQIDNLNLSNSVKLMGKSNNISEEMSKSKIFVLSSRYEGMPNALIEAMASGVACVATNCDFGPSELIQDQDSGILVSVNDAKQLANAIESIIKNNSLRIKLANNATHINKRLNKDTIYSNYLSYITQE